MDEVNLLAHLNAKWHNNQLELEISQLPKIFNNASKFFTAPMHKLVNKYADDFIKLG